MFLVPNKLNYGICPHCNWTLNQWDYIPASAIGSIYFQPTKCPNLQCLKDIVVKVHITFDVEVGR